jgi:hypothetical protein
MPAAKLRPVLPSTTTVPPVMYSQPWSPVPSTTAVAPDRRTAKRSPATPRKKASPLVAPYSAVLPMMMFFGGVAAEVDARPHRDAPARQALAGVVVGVADQVQRDALGQEGAEALAAGAFHLHEDGVVGQALGAAADQLARQHGADAAVDVARVLHELHLLAALDGGRHFSISLTSSALCRPWSCSRPGGAARRPAPRAGGTRG